MRQPICSDTSQRCSAASDWQQQLLVSYRIVLLIAGWPFYSHFENIFSASTARLLEQHSAKRKPSSSCRTSVFAEYRRQVCSLRTLTRPTILSFSRWCESVEPGIPS